MTAKCNERDRLRNMLYLNSAQMKILATIAGNDHTGHLVATRCDFHRVADFCRSIDLNQSDPKAMQSIYQKIEKYMMLNASSRVGIDSIAKSIQSYDINYDIDKFPDALNEYCAENVLMFAFLNQQVFQYEVNFLDFKQRNKNGNNNNNVQLFSDTLLEVFRKLGGILLNGTSHTNPMLKIVTKYSLYEKYTLREHPPIYPEGNEEFKVMFQFD